MTVHVRSATLDDVPMLRRFEQGIVAAERPFDPTLRPDPITYHDLESLIASPDAEVAVAESREKPIGCGFARKRASRHYTEPPFHAHLGFMYVEPDARGEGVNRLILDHLFAWARRNGLTETRLTVYPDNAPAVRAYEKAGFTAHLLEMRMGIDE
ncbi:MAG: GNAT family N-acetyltransferase [Planctomycetota bacterium]